MDKLTVTQMIVNDLDVIALVLAPFVVVLMMTVSVPLQILATIDQGLERGVGVP